MRVIELNNDFVIRKSIDDVILKKNYVLHTHDTMHEIILFISGDCEFYVEGNIYKLNPYDIVIASNNELHRMVHNSPQKYDRYLININTDFFAKNNCIGLENIFKKQTPGTYNYISADVVKKTKIIDLIEKTNDYFLEGEAVVAKCVLIELLYTINKVSHPMPYEGITSKYIPDIVAYINQNLSDDLSLPTLSEKFHISQAHISRLFKKHMKMSVKKYITYKRLILVRELCLSKESLLNASLAAGFSNYSSFYRSYVKEFHHPPKLDLK